MINCGCNMARSRIRISSTALLLLLAATSAVRAESQRDEANFVDDGLAPLVLGGRAGAVLSVTLVQAAGGAQQISDGAAMTVPIVFGIALGFVARTTADSRFGGRLRASGGTSSQHYWEYAL